jgi:hypothetical protein
MLTAVNTAIPGSCPFIATTTVMPDAPLAGAASGGHGCSSSQLRSLLRHGSGSSDCGQWWYDVEP